VAEIISAEERERLEGIALAADHGDRPWVWKASEADGSGGYPQQIIRDGDATLVATCYDAPEYPATKAEFIATFDPPTVLRLLASLRATSEGER
jgi:hypothetical protein